MKYFLHGFFVSMILTLSACSGSSTTPSTPQVSWTWMSGGNESNAFGVYGTLGTPSISNIPGARWGAISWVDESGSFWLFGGDGNATNESGNLNDLWKYNPTTNQWTWVGGSNASGAYGVYGTQQVASNTNIPGSRSGGVSWRDNSGNLWMFGGLGHDADSTGYLNDLWEYNPNTNQWVWQNGSQVKDLPGVYGVKGVAGHLNQPGSRIGATSWTDGSGNLWLFGGVNLTQHRFNDLWKYSPATNQWTWFGGESTTDGAGIYGTKGLAESSNQPGARYDATSWVDNNGNFWIFGGFGNDASSPTAGWLNDLWKYDPYKQEWTWIKGSNTENQDGIYGDIGVGSPANTPGARNHRVPFAWSDKNGNFWLFGGFGFVPGSEGLLNDLWMYDPSKDQWTWESGSVESNAFGNYGLKGVPASSNQPGAHRDAVGWIDDNSNLWVFGGAGNGASTSGNLNDLWRYNGVGAQSPFPIVQYTLFPSYNSSSTFITGVRTISNSSNVYLSVISPSTTSSVGLVYAGPLNGQGGQWYQLNYPASSGVTVQSTTLYGPNNGSSDGTINVVGSFTSAESPGVSFGLLYQGKLTDGNNSSNWTILTPPSAISTIAHSNMGNLVAGNYNIQSDPAGKAFIYDMNTKEYTEITKQDAKSVTIYGIWYNGGNSYTIAGGYSRLNIQGLDIGYVADYDASTQAISNWTSYSYNNLPLDSVVSHFEGITGDGYGGYNLAADVGGIGSLTNGYQSTFVHIARIGSAFYQVAKWTDINYPGSILSSANTVNDNNLLGVYLLTPDFSQVRSFFATVPVTN